MRLRHGWKLFAGVLLVLFTFTQILIAPITKSVGLDGGGVGLPKKQQDEVRGNNNNSSTNSSAKDPAPPPELPKPQCTVTILGYLICGASWVIGKLLDGSFWVLKTLLVVRPLDMSTSGGQRLYEIWGVLRNIANVVFVLMLLLVILSQSSSIGLSNYNIKRMLPRLIVNIILVNVSFFIGLLVIDVANILGGTLYKTFETIAGAVGPFDIGLGGATVTVLGLGAGVALIFVFATSLIGMLGSALVTICTVIIYLVARQALLIALVVVSPVAFALNVLPGTQKWFSKWWNALFTSAMVYPVISLIFGGSVLAATIIRVSPISGIPGGAGVAALLSLAAQTLPFFLVPKFMKMSGSLLSQVSSAMAKPLSGRFEAIKDSTQRFGRRRGMVRQINALERGKKYSPYAAMARANAGIKNLERRQNRQLKPGTSNTGRTAYDDFYQNNSEKIIKHATAGMPEKVRRTRQAAMQKAAEDMSFRLSLTDVDIADFKLTQIDGANLADLRAVANDDSVDLSDSRRIAAIARLASQGNLAELHRILEMVEAEGGGSVELQHKLADAIEESGIGAEAAHLTGSGVDSIRSGEAFRRGNVVGSLYENAHQKLSSEGLSTQSSASLNELDRYKDSLSDEARASIKQSAVGLSSNQKLQLNMSGASMRASQRIANW